MKKDILILIKENSNLIYKIASKYSKFSNIDDLYQVGVIGLINAYNNFDCNKLTKFTTYAYTYILGEILNFVRIDKSIKVSKEYLAIFKKYNKYKELLSQKLGRIPSNYEISEKMNINLNDLNEVILTGDYVMSLDQEIDQFKIYDVVGKDDKNLNSEIILIKEMIKTLPSPDKEIIQYRYFNDFTQGETAKILKMTQVQVSRYENKVLKKLKTKIIS